jgi:hypothetical protein
MGPETKNDCTDEDQQQFTAMLCYAELRYNEYGAYSERPEPPLVE